MIGDLIKGIAPIAVGAMFPVGLPAVLAGSATGALIAKASGEDVLTGAAMGGLGGMGGADIGAAANKTKLANNALMGGSRVPTEAITGGISSLTDTVSNLGGGSTLKGVGKLGAIGLPAIGRAMIPEYNANPDDDPMSKYDPKRRLNLDMPTGIRNALARDSKLRLNQPFMQLNEGGYLPFELRKDAADMSPEDMEAFRQFMMERQLREAEEEEMDSEKGIKMLDTILGMQEGGYLETGMGDGMSDDIPSSIDGEQPAALSENEFVIPADVVSHIGNGSSDAGAKKLYAMMDKIRQARTGREKQAPQINAEEMMPA
tara:strand:- start:1317 stop:2264 length:948 start_codon:yes stop_codon:yes gene_type:complete